MKVLHLVGVLLGPPSTPKLLLSAEACVQELHLTPQAKWVRMGGKEGTDIDISFNGGHTTFPVEFLTPPDLARSEPDLGEVEHVAIQTPKYGVDRRRVFQVNRREKKGKPPLSIEKKTNITAEDWHVRLGHAEQKRAIRSGSRCTQVSQSVEEHDRLVARAQPKVQPTTVRSVFVDVGI